MGAGVCVSDLLIQFQSRGGVKQMRNSRKALKYGLFALISIAINLAVQKISNSIYTGFLFLYLGLLLGTIVGLVVKYILDKKFIFYHRIQTKGKETKAFILYSLMGALTTIIFWGLEIAFDLAFASENAKYLGGALGLSIGYLAKYYLDRKFVFVSANA